MIIQLEGELDGTQINSCHPEYFVLGFFILGFAQEDTRKGVFLHLDKLKDLFVLGVRKTTGSDGFNTSRLCGSVQVELDQPLMLHGQTVESLSVPLFLSFLDKIVQRLDSPNSLELS